MAASVRHHAVQVPATSANLGPGFDAFGVALDRYVTVRTVDRAGQDERVANVTGDPVPTGDDNLVWRSFVDFCGAHDTPVPDVGLRVANDIPLERGLGSSSGAIVAGLVLASTVTGTVVSDLDLVRLATEIEGHPDNVAPAILGGLVACSPGERGLVVRRVNPAAHLRPVVLVPRERQATEAARAVVPDSLTRDQVVSQAARAGHVLAALAGVWPADVDAVGDLLHEPARSRTMPASGQALDALRDRGLHAWLSGAGPSVAAAVPLRSDGSGADDALPGAISEIAAEVGFSVLAARFELSGALACPEDGCGISGVGDCVQCPRRRV